MITLDKLLARRQELLKAEQELTNAAVRVQGSLMEVEHMIALAGAGEGKGGSGQAIHRPENLPDAPEINDIAAGMDDFA